MASSESIYFGLIGLAAFGGDPVRNLEITREIQRVVVEIQIAEVRKALDEGRTWREIAEAVHRPEQETRDRFEPLLG